VSEIDFDAEGLLDGVQGEARPARMALLNQLADAGVPLEELRRAVAEDRLALLPAERMLGGEGRYTAGEVAELAGLDPELLVEQWRALGLSLPGPGERSMTEEDLEAARRTRAYWSAGLPDEGLLEVSRVIGLAMSQIAAAMRHLIAEALIQPGDTEHAAGLRFAAVSRELLPLLGPTLEYVFRLHFREQLRQDAVGRADLETGIAGTEEVTVCFADIVGFTRLGERLDVEEVGALGGRLAELATSVARPPVRLVKLIGDAAMLVSPDTEAVVDAGLAMLEAAEGDERLPPLRVGLATGTALGRGGDWYGRPVNLAARITSVARPGSALATREVRERAGDERFRWSFAHRRHLRGISGEITLYRVRRAEGSEQAGPGRAA
jgi:adenylate cyclase